MPLPSAGFAWLRPPAYLAEHGVPQVPQDLGCHSCINLRMVSGTIYAWEYEKGGRELNIKVGGQLLFDGVDLVVVATLSRHGLIHLIEDRILSHIAEGTLVRVLGDWCEPFDGYYMCYPSRRQPSAAFRLLLDAPRYRL